MKSTNYFIAAILVAHLLGAREGNASTALTAKANAHAALKLPDGSTGRGTVKGKVLLADAMDPPLWTHIIFSNKETEELAHIRIQDDGSFCTGRMNPGIWSAGLLTNGKINPWGVARSWSTNEAQQSPSLPAGSIPVRIQADVNHLRDLDFRAKKVCELTGHINLPAKAPPPPKPTRIFSCALARQLSNPSLEWKWADVELSSANSGLLQSSAIISNGAFRLASQKVGAHILNINEVNLGAGTMSFSRTLELRPGSNSITLSPKWGVLEVSVPPNMSKCLETLEIEWSNDDAWFGRRKFEHIRKESERIKEIVLGVGQRVTPTYPRFVSAIVPEGQIDVFREAESGNRILLCSGHVFAHKTTTLKIVNPLEDALPQKGADRD